MPCHVRGNIVHVSGVKSTICLERHFINKWRRKLREAYSLFPGYATWSSSRTTPYSTLPSSSLALVGTSETERYIFMHQNHLFVSHIRITCFSVSNFRLQSWVYLITITKLRFYVPAVYVILCIDAISELLLVRSDHFGFNLTIDYLPTSKWFDCLQSYKICKFLAILLIWCVEALCQLKY